MGSASHPCPAGTAGAMLLAPAAAYYFRRDRDLIAELEYKLLEARQRVRDLKAKNLWGNPLKVCGCGCCRHSYVRTREQKASNMCTGSDPWSVAETSPKIVGNQVIRQQMTKSV